MRDRANQAGASRWWLLPVLAALAFVGLRWWGVNNLPFPTKDTVAVADGVTGVLADGSYAYIIHREGTYVLVDAGNDPQATALLAALERLDANPALVKAVLITHGHQDHWAGTHKFENAQVFAGAGDVDLIRGERKPHGLMARVAGKLAPRPPVPQNLNRILAGSRLEFGPITLEAIAVPGHTPGSMMYRHGPILFTGDSLFHRLTPDADGDAEPQTANPKGQAFLLPWFFSHRFIDNERSLLRLRSVPFRTMADGHVGSTSHGRALYDRWLAANGPRLQANLNAGAAGMHARPR